jgi:hypothetical protein
VHMRERQCELGGQRKQRAPRSDSRSEPTHRTHVSRPKGLGSKPKPRSAKSSRQPPLAAWANPYHATPHLPTIPPRLIAEPVYAKLCGRFGVVSKELTPVGRINR